MEWGVYTVYNGGNSNGIGPMAPMRCKVSGQLETCWIWCLGSRQFATYLVKGLLEIRRLGLTSFNMF